MTPTKISFIIPIPPEGECELSLASIRRQNYDPALIEVLVSVGRHRSIQRNEAIAAATGEILFFLDNDVIIKDPEYINKHLALYQADPRLASVGGPSLTPDSDSLLQHSFGQIFASSFATQSIRARYWPVGEKRQAGEKELILCNQSMRADVVKKLGGFNSHFHSGNEENELINRIQKAGYYLLYDPHMSVERSQRKSLRAFCFQIAKYGKSRIEHFLIKPESFELKFLAPLAFLAYLGAVPVAPLILRGHFLTLFYLPLLLYTLLGFCSAVASYLRYRKLVVALLTFLLYPVHHASYGLGNLIGLYRFYFPGKDREIPVEIRKIAL